MEYPHVPHRRGQRPGLQHLKAIGDLTLRSWKVRNEVAVDQPLMKVAAKTGEATIGSVAVVEAATAEGVAKTTMTGALSAVVVATAVIATVAAAAVAAVPAG